MGLKNNKNITISIKELGHLFPFYILLSEDLKIESYGRSMEVLFTNYEENESFFENWKIDRPLFLENTHFDSITGKLVVISNKKNDKLKFKGQFEKIKSENNYIFLGSPWFNNSDQLIENNLSISDFAIHDSISDLLLVLKHNEISNIELKETLNKVNEQRIKISQTNEQLKLFRNLIDNSSDSIQVADESGRLVYINNTASERLGIAPEKCQEFNVRQFEKIFSNINDWNNHVEELKKTTQLSIEGENENVLTGEHFYVEVYVNYFKVEDKGYIIANSRDISQRKKNELQLKLQEEKYQNIIANMNLGLLEVDLDEKIEFCNQSFTDISGYTLDELKGKNASLLFINQNVFPTINKSTVKREKGISDSYEILVLNKYKEPKWWLISGGPKYDSNGKIIGSIGIHLDITKQKKIDTELENALASAQAASIAKEAFLANMSHEIRTPLNGIIGMINQLNKENISPQQLKYVENAQTASDHLLSIINNILDLSKIEAGEFKLELKDTCVRTLINDSIKILENQISEKNLSHELTISPKINEYLVIDKSRFRQILINIIGNAIKFTEKGKITIDCSLIKSTLTTQTIQISIKDTGIGMDASFLDKIFTKFNQEDISSSRRYGGSGLGMIISKQIIGIMNGKIAIESEKNIGTEVTIELTFPISENTSIPEKSNLKANFLTKDTKILVVEDNEMNRLVVNNFLSPYTENITEAENGNQAVDLLSKSNFDIVLMDLQMPFMDGIEATKIIRNELQLKIPIIGVSANAFQSEIEKCIENGMDDYITKPFKEEKLLEKINKLLEKNNTKLTNEFVQLYNLVVLKEMSRGDYKFVVKMLELFITSIPENIKELKIGLKEKDYEKIKKIIHKLKPMISNLKIESLFETIKKIEISEITKEHKTQLTFLVIEVCDILQKTCTQIKDNELNEKRLQ